MNSISTHLRRTTSFLALTSLLLFANTDVISQPAGNLLANGSFESPVMTVVNANNIIGAGKSWGSWNCTNGGFNILHVTGSGYLSGANHAEEGNQYADVASSDGFISQSFVLTQASPLSFSGSYSSREAGWSDYANWTAKIDILDSTGNIIASSAPRNFVTTDNMETWHNLAGSTSILPAGTYTYRAYAGNSGHFDNAVVTALVGQVLAVKLINFTTTEKNNQLISTWTISNNENVMGFELEGSSDGTNFRSIRSITANSSKTYTISNRRPSNHHNYYRLKIINHDGSPVYSHILNVRPSSITALSLFPNPASSYFNLSVETDMINASAFVSVVNAVGQVVKQQQFARLSQTEMIDISGLHPGTYFVRLTTPSSVILKTLEVVRA